MMQFIESPKGVSIVVDRRRRSVVVFVVDMNRLLFVVPSRYARQVIEGEQTYRSTTKDKSGKLSER